MVVQHNITAMNANRMLGVTSGLQAKSTEKLSSGYKINRAADDAAGLSISEKMRKQIRGLSQASDNAEDGISCVQTAEGALTEVHSMLQRMNELAVKAGNGTMSEDDRQNVQDEIDQLVDEIDRVSETTKFNETYLLKGDSVANGNTKAFTAGDVIGKVDGVTVKANGTTAATLQDNADIAIGTVELKSSNAAVTIENSDDAACKAKDVVKFVSDGKNATVTLKNGTEVTDTVANIKTNYEISAEAGGKAVAASATISNALKADTTNATISGTYTGSLADLSVGDTVNVKLSVGAAGVSALSSDTKALMLSFQVGADTTDENKITVSMDSMSAKSIGVDGIKVYPGRKAIITSLDKAIESLEGKTGTTVTFA